jgi:hypothetical protein
MSPRGRIERWRRLDSTSTSGCRALYEWPAVEATTDFSTCTEPNALVPDWSGGDNRGLSDIGRQISAEKIGRKYS